MTTLFNLTYFSFLACGLASVLAVFYCLVQAPRLSGQLRLLALLNIIVCAASGVLHLYFFMHLQPVVAGAGVASVNEMASAIGDLPLIVRYGYWMATTSMLIIMFPLLMGLERVGLAFAIKLVMIDVAMIATGYLGERSILAGDGVNLAALTWLTISGMLWMAMSYYIFRALRALPGKELIPVQRDALIYMFFFFLIGWAIFPAGFFYAMVFDSGIGVLLREFTVNLGDLVNKVLWGFLVVHAATEISKSMRARSAA